MRIGGSASVAGALSLHVFRAPKQGIRGFLAHALPRPGLPREINAWRLRNLPRLLWQAGRVMVAVGIAKASGVATAYGRLSLRVYSADGSVVDLGIASYRVVTTAGVNFIRDAFLNSVEAENMKYHGFGTGTTAEANGDTALVTELTTEYATDSTRPTGSQASGGTGIYTTVGTLSPDANVAITEHGIFSQAATGGGTLLDRSKFSAVNLVGSADSLQATYSLTVAAGG